jgi:hypothetical protein
MFKAILGAYLIIGILSLFYRMDRLHKDLETQGPFIKVRIYQVIIALMAILAWPFRLADLQDEKPNGIDILLDVSEAFQEVAKERGEEIDRHTMGFIISKFILMNKQFGSKFCREHLKYELEKYKKEGLRGDYVEGGASLKIAQ